MCVSCFSREYGYVIVNSITLVGRPNTWGDSGRDCMRLYWPSDWALTKLKLAFNCARKLGPTRRSIKLFNGVPLGPAIRVILEYAIGVQ